MKRNKTIFIELFQKARTSGWYKVSYKNSSHGQLECFCCRYRTKFGEKVVFIPCNYKQIGASNRYPINELPAAKYIHNTSLQHVEKSILSDYYDRFDSESFHLMELVLPE